MLTHKQVAQLHPLSGYSITKTTPEWVLFHEFSISDNNYITITSETSPELCVSRTKGASFEFILEQKMGNLVFITFAVIEVCPGGSLHLCWEYRLKAGPWAVI